MDHSLTALRTEFDKMAGSAGIAQLDMIVLQARARHGYRGTFKDAEEVMRASGEFELAGGQEGYTEVKRRAA